MLEGLFAQLAAKSPPPAILVPPVPPRKKQREPLQATEYKAVPPVPPVPPEKTEIKKQNDNAGLSAADSQRLLDYLAAIDETDPVMIDELLTECSKDADKLAWALGWSDKVLAAQAKPMQLLVTCGICQYFLCFTQGEFSLL